MHLIFNILYCLFSWISHWFANISKSSFTSMFPRRTPHKEGDLFFTGGGHSRFVINPFSVIYFLYFLKNQFRFKTKVIHANFFRDLDTCLVFTVYMVIDVFLNFTWISLLFLFALQHVIWRHFYTWNYLRGISKTK